MLAIGWADRLTYDPDDDFVFSCTDPSLPGGEGNLCVRAARKVAAALGRTASGRLRLEKAIPHGAGLGGGSSDAAATLQLLHEQWGGGLPAAELHRLAAELGSDVPFFLDAEPALAAGRGERIRHLPEYRLPFPIVVVVPHVRISTPDAYRMLSPRADDRPDLAVVVGSNDLERWTAELRNDFSEPIRQRFPPVAKAWALLRDRGAGYVSLSGSGSSVYGVFRDLPSARSAAEEAGHRGLSSWVGFAAASHSLSDSAA